MNKPVKYYNMIDMDRRLKDDNLSVIENFFNKSRVTAEDFQEVSTVMRLEGIYALDWEVSEYSSHSLSSHSFSFYEKESEESAEARYQSDIKKYNIWLTKGEERLRSNAKRFGYKLVKEENDKQRI
jgi:hypothetical protein